MKLIDLLVKELPKSGGWPDGYDVVSTNGYGAVWAYKTKGCAAGRELYFHSTTEGHVTKSQYEAALAKNDGWIEWGGGECPVDIEEVIDIKFRGGEIKTDKAFGWRWHHDNNCMDIIAYRLHKPDINSRANDDRMEQDLNECIGQDVDVPEWNGDGLPPVGCECEVKRAVDWVKCKILFISDTHVVLMADEECCWNTCACQFRPLRTEAEKLREKLAASLHIAAGASPIELNGIGHLYFKLADAIISGSVFGTTFKENK